MRDAHACLLVPVTSCVTVLDLRSRVTLERRGGLWMELNRRHGPPCAWAWPCHRRQGPSWAQAAVGTGLATAPPGAQALDHHRHDHRSCG